MSEQEETPKRQMNARIAIEIDCGRRINPDAWEIRTANKLLSDHLEENSLDYQIEQHMMRQCMAHRKGEATWPFPLPSYHNKPETIQRIQDNGWRVVQRRNWILPESRFPPSSYVHFDGVC